MLNKPEKMDPSPDAQPLDEQKTDAVFYEGQSAFEPSFLYNNLVQLELNDSGTNRVFRRITGRFG